MICVCTFVCMSVIYVHILIPILKRICTGVFLLQNAQPLFCTETLDRRTYLAELDEILHGIPNGDNLMYYRGIFGYSVWVARCGVPSGPLGPLGGTVSPLQK